MEKQPALLGIRDISWERPNPARDIPHLRLDLDDVGTEVAEKLRTVRTCHEFRQVEDSNSI